MTQYTVLRMKMPVAIAFLLSIGQCVAGSMFWTVATDKALVRSYPARPEDHPGIKALGLLSECLSGLSDKEIRGVLVILRCRGERDPISERLHCSIDNPGRLREHDLQAIECDHSHLHAE